MNDKHLKPLLPAVAAMCAVVVASNILVQYPLNDWLTLGAFTYPVAFLVSDLTNRRFGPERARRVAWAGFALAVVLSGLLSDWRIALASGTAFLCAQFVDIAIFDCLRRGRWWQAPLVSSALASVLDTALFFSLAFAGTGLPWITWGIGDLGVKLLMALAMLAPFRILMRVIGQRPESMPIAP